MTLIISKDINNDVKTKNTIIFDENVRQRAIELFRSLGPTHKDIADKLDVSVPTVQRLLKGDAKITLDQLEKSLDLVSREELERIFQQPREDITKLPIHDIEVSAGGGSIVGDIAEASAIGEMPFPAEWLRNEFGDINKLRLVKVRGESMVPVLSDGDLIMIHLAQTDVVNSIAVVRQADQLQVKRLVRDGVNVILQSANAAYPTITIDLRDDDKRDGFEVIGRVVWTGRKV